MGRRFIYVKDKATGAVEEVEITTTPYLNRVRDAHDLRSLAAGVMPKQVKAAMKRVQDEGRARHISTDGIGYDEHTGDVLFENVSAQDRFAKIGGYCVKR